MPNKEDYAWYKSHGICPTCGKQKSIKGKVNCLECSGRNLEWSVAYFQNLSEQCREARKKRVSEYNKRIRKERKQKGLCTACGKKQARENKTLCNICANKQKRNNEKYMRKKAESQGKDMIQRQFRTSLGMCYICGKAVSPENRNFCHECLERQRSKAEHMRKFIDYETNPWCVSFREMQKLSWIKYQAKQQQNRRKNDED